VLFAASVVVSFIAEVVLVSDRTDALGSFADPSLIWRGTSVLLGLTLPDIAAMALPFGLGVPVHLDVSGFGIPGGDLGSVSVFDLVGHGGMYWLWPVVAVLLMAGTGYLAGRWSPVTRGGRSTAPLLGAVLPVVLLALALMSSGTGGLAGLVPGLAIAKPDILLTVVFGALWGAGAGLLGMVLVGRRPVPPPQEAPAMVTYVTYDQPALRWSTADYPLVEPADRSAEWSDPFARRFGLAPPEPPPRRDPPQQGPAARPGQGV